MSSYEHRAATSLGSVLLVERPDEARFTIFLSIDGVVATAALESFKRCADRLTVALQPLQATVRVLDFDLMTPQGKLGGNGPSRIELLVLIPLSIHASPWERAAKVAQADGLLFDAQAEAKRSKPSIELRRELPVYGLAEPERLRARLVQRAMERAKSLGSEIILTNVRFDAAVMQRPVGLEQVEVTLPIEGVAELNFP